MRDSQRAPIRFLRELRLPRDERAAARAERKAEAEMSRERDNLHSADRRAARVEAERRKEGLWRH
jgi:hypothetical protein